MRHRSFSLSLCLLLFLNAAPSFAAAPVPAAPPAALPPTATAIPLPTVQGTQPPTQPPIQPIQLVSDEKAHVVRVLIDGKVILAIDATGLHVQGDVAYSGLMTDAGGSLKMP